MALKSSNNENIANEAGSGLPLTGTISGSPLTGAIEFNSNSYDFLSASILGSNGLGSFLASDYNSTYLGAYLNTYLDSDGSLASNDLVAEINNDFSSSINVSSGSNGGFGGQKSSIDLEAKAFDTLSQTSKTLSLSFNTATNKENHIVITDDFGVGLTGAADYSAGYDPNTYVQKVYVDSLARPYKVYTALLTQTGTNAPVATVLENTLGFIPTYTYDFLGQYSLIGSIGSFPIDKTFISVASNNDEPYLFKAYRNTDTQFIYLQSFENTTNGYVQSDGALLLGNGGFVEIRVYN